MSIIKLYLKAIVAMVIACSLILLPFEKIQAVNAYPVIPDMPWDYQAKVVTAVGNLDNAKLVSDFMAEYRISSDYVVTASIMDSGIPVSQESIYMIDDPDVVNYIITSTMGPQKENAALMLAVVIVLSTAVYGTIIYIVIKKYAPNVPWFPPYTNTFNGQPIYMN